MFGSVDGTLIADFRLSAMVELRFRNSDVRSVRSSSWFDSVSGSNLDRLGGSASVSVVVSTTSWT